MEARTIIDTNEVIADSEDELNSLPGHVGQNHSISSFTTINHNPDQTPSSVSNFDTSYFDAGLSGEPSSIADRAKTRQRTQARKSAPIPSGDIIEITSDEEVAASNNSSKPKSKPKPKPKPRPRPKLKTKEKVSPPVPSPTEQNVDFPAEEQPRPRPRLRPRPKSIAKRTGPLMDSDSPPQCLFAQAPGTNASAIDHGETPLQETAAPQYEQEAVVHSPAPAPKVAIIPTRNRALSINGDGTTPLYARYEVAPRRSSLTVSELIRRANSQPGSPYPTTGSPSCPSTPSSRAMAYSPYLKSSRRALSRIAPLHPNRKTPPPPPPPPPPKKKTKKELEREEKWEEELVESVGGIEAWAAMNEVDRKDMRRAKQEMELGGYED